MLREKGNASLRATGLSKSFNGVPAVSSVDLDLDIGESVGVIGPNGAGKSTLLGLLVGSLKADEGRLVMQGRDLTRAAVHKRVTAGIARAAQIPQTFGRLTVSENLRLPAVFGAGLHGAEAARWVEEVLEMCGLADHAGTDAEHLGLLSRKRLELAKAVAARPKVLLLDEVGAGLTEPEIEQIMELVRTLREGRAVMWVEHIPFALRGVCERLVVMDKGAKILDGPFEEVWADPDLQAIYMGVPDDAVA
jgi:branched-chain amino acid transport system ATP-binding protein